MPRKKRNKKELEFPLLKKLSGEDIFNQREKVSIPDFAKFNLKHKLRDYQKQALENFIISQEKYKLNHLLFNMATGSGKTDLMAALILLMYKYGYQEFLFTVNTNAVISKTRENLVNEHSSKYLFNSPISINGERIEIRAVSSFPINKEPGVIYLKLTTIQTLTNELNNPIENGLTEADLQKHEIVILADEAHHLSATTKEKVQDKTPDSVSWENTINKILYSNRNNQLLEFTATVNWDDERLYEKYKDKLVYKYDLGHFIQDGFSKNVYRLQANSDDETKMLNAVLLSQYRKYIAQKNNINDFKPVILFKSNTITSSKENNKKFKNLIDKLNIDFLEKFLSEENFNNSNALKLTFNYFKNQDLGSVINDIKQDFDDRNVINVNVESSNEGILGDTDNFKKLNTLEDINNPCRAIFAVAKLNEGWDVLNLYDIVRLGESKGAGKKTTDQEAQLIGRGARYYPFKINGKCSYTRRFDNSADNELQLLENLYYHTSNDSKYLNYLKKSLDKMQLIMKEDNVKAITYTANLKSSFKKSSVYRNGVFYYNEVEEIPEQDFDKLISYGIDTQNIYQVDLTKSVWEANYDAEVNNEESQVKTIRVDEIGRKARRDSRLLNKAISRNRFYRFNTLKEYLPTLSSMDEFLFDEKWLGNVRLDVKVEENKVDLTVEEKLQAIEKYLEMVQSKIVRNFKRSRGTNNFKPIKISEVLDDYSKKIPQSFNTVDMVIEPHKINEDWFAYDYAIVDRLEKSLIDLIRNFVDEIKEKYKNVYLFRIDEQNTNFKLHDFGKDITHFEGFMPDFILYLENEESIYQLYIEPKGEQLVERDKWKEKLLEKISPNNIELIGENDKLYLYGVKFYRNGDINNIEAEIKDKVNLTVEDNI